MYNFSTDQSSFLRIKKILVLSFIQYSNIITIDSTNFNRQSIKSRIIKFGFILIGDFFSSSYYHLTSLKIVFLNATTHRCFHIKNSVLTLSRKPVICLTREVPYIKLFVCTYYIINIINKKFFLPRLHWFEIIFDTKYNY